MRLMILISILCFGAGGFALHLFSKEYSIALFSLRSSNERFEILRSDAPSRAMTLRSDRELFLACDDALNGAMAQFRSEDALLAVATHCRDFASASMRSATSSSTAHYTLALAAIFTGDNEKLNYHLTLSQKLGAFESWLASRRFNLAWENESKLNSNGRLALGADIAALLQGHVGRTFLAGRSAEERQLRDLVLTIAETQDQDIQRSYFFALRAALRRASQT